jgi:hypothetical protein
MRGWLRWRRVLRVGLGLSSAATWLQLLPGVFINSTALESLQKTLRTTPRFPVQQSHAPLNSLNLSILSWPPPTP